MTLDISTHAASWFLPFALPICLWVIWSDLSAMRIPNTAVLTLAGIFVVVGLLVLPLADYPWRLLNLVVVLALGIAANAAGLVGAGDAKFAAAAAPFVAPGDVSALMLIFAANLLAALATHAMAKRSALRRLAPDWRSWSQDKKFPMGFALGGTLAIYLTLGIAQGA